MKPGPRRKRDRMSVYRFTRSNTNQRNSIAGISTSRGSGSPKKAAIKDMQKSGMPSVQIARVVRESAFLRIFYNAEVLVPLKFLINNESYNGKEI